MDETGLLAVAPKHFLRTGFSYVLHRHLLSRALLFDRSLLPSVDVASTFSMCMYITLITEGAFLRLSHDALEK